MWNTSDFTVQNTTNVSDSFSYGDGNWEVLVLLPIMLFGITGNILVCMAVSMEKRLQSVTNYFLLSLAITDLLVSVVVMPFSMIHQFFGYWPFDYIVCDMYVTSDVLMCTSSILHLCTISLERYLAIRSPLSLRNKSKGVVLWKIVLVWASSLAITSPITILGIVDQKNVLNNKQCALTNEYFIIYGSTAAFFIPLGIMITTYGLTVRLLHKQSQLCNPSKDQEGEPMMRRSVSRRAKFRQRVKFEPRRTKSCPNKNCRDSNYSQYLRTRSVRECKHGAKSELDKLEMTPPSSPHLTVPDIGNDLDTISEENHNNGIDWRKSSLTGTTCSIISEDSPKRSILSSPLPHRSIRSNHSMNGSESPSPKRLKNLVSRHQLVLKATSILLLRKDQVSENEQSDKQSMSPRHDQDDVNTEHKASKVLGVVFGIFVICWAPFFIVNILTVLCHDCQFQPLLFTTFVWLGYVSSTLNPIIYTIFNKTFKMTFVKLLRCRYRTIQKSLRVRWHSRNGYQSTFRTHSYYSSDDKVESQL
uniref:5-HT2-3 n=1 Tax=Sinonovacula constricta TaxID=98310 RepID=A0AA95Z9B2_SINCO|nr:5-HT2-3 [Sinonovacula constricta]